MSQESRRSRGQRGAGSGVSRRTLWYGGSTVAAILAIVAMAIFNQQAAAIHHPAPRTAESRVTPVVPAARYSAYPRVATTYEAVAAVPDVIDGIFCYCMCAEHSGHYSLFDCFTSDHAARCDVCLSEATMAYQMTKDGKDLKTIRAEIDGRFQT